MDKDTKNHFSRQTKSIIELSILFLELSKKPNDAITLDDWKNKLVKHYPKLVDDFTTYVYKHNLMKTSKKKQ